jgi:hypothetical protein
VTLCLRALPLADYAWYVKLVFNPNIYQRYTNKYDESNNIIFDSTGTGTSTVAFELHIYGNIDFNLEVCISNFHVYGTVRLAVIVTVGGNGLLLISKSMCGCRLLELCE